MRRRADRCGKIPGPDAAPEGGGERVEGFPDGLGGAGLGREQALAWPNIIGYRCGLASAASRTRGGQAVCVTGGRALAQADAQRVLDMAGRCVPR